MDETKAHLEALGLPPERITVSGIPIDPIFAEPVDRARAARFATDSMSKRPTLLLSAGALGVGPTELIVERLKHLRNDMQTIVICGKSEEVKTRVTNAVGRTSAVSVSWVTTDRMHELMHMSDLFIGKPGGLTTSEAMACGLPMAVFRPFPARRSAIADHLLEEGAAIRCNELTTCPSRSTDCSIDPERLAAMRRAALALGRPHAARTIVETLLSGTEAVCRR